MNRILKYAMWFVVSAAVLVPTVGTVALVWAMHGSQDRAACYRSGAALEACGKPSFIERTMAHYVAQVDL